MWREVCGRDPAGAISTGPSAHTFGSRETELSGPGPHVCNELSHCGTDPSGSKLCVRACVCVYRQVTCILIHVTYNLNQTLYVSSGSGVYIHLFIGRDKGGWSKALVVSACKILYNIQY